MMSTMIEFVSNSGPVELLRLVSMEVALACFAAMVYFTLTGYVVPTSTKKGRKSGKKDHMANPPKKENVPLISDLTKALRQGNWKEALPLLSELGPGYLPANIAPRFLMAAAKASHFDDVMAELQGFQGRIESKSLEAVASEACKMKDASVCKHLQSMSVSLSIVKTSLTLELLAQGLASDVPALRTLVEGVETPLPTQFAKVVLEACAAMKEVDLAAEVFEKVSESDAAFLRGAVEKAATGAPRTSQYHYKASLQHAKEVRDCAKNGDFDGAVQIFERYNKVGASSILCNGVLDACMECGDFEKAVAYFNRASGSGLADTVSYNIMIKGYVNKGDEEMARTLLAQLIATGLIPSQASYHVLLNDMMSKGNSKGVWRLLDDMQAVGVAPSGITCSILLKGKSVSSSDVDRVLMLIETLDEAMDDVLFSTLAEACIRTGHLKSLSALMDKKCSQDSALVLTAPTGGSMIKAYGQLRDVKRIWSVWRAMEGSKVQPTAITLGCMVEALVCNHCTADAWKLARELRSEEGTRPLVNTVIYSTILKGFANMKETDKVMALYEEMKSLGIQPNTITYNTILNAFAQGAAMDRVPALLEDMKAADPPAEPDIVTYSTIIKGFCRAGSLNQALAILKDMQSDARCRPDEVMYNSLLDGCAREQRPDEALKLLDDMRKGGVAPSNFTLSMLVKLMGRCKRLNKAFSLVEELSSEYGLKVNIQVYTCLLQACFNNRQAAKAVALYNKIIDEGLRPDEMTYSSLVSGCLKAGLVDKAVHLVKCAHGVAHPRSKGAPAGVSSRCLGDVIYSLGGSGSAPARALLAELEDAKAGKGKGSSKGGLSAKAPWNSRS